MWCGWRFIMGVSACWPTVLSTSWRKHDKETRPGQCFPSRMRSFEVAHDQKDFVRNLKGRIVSGGGL